MKIKKKKFTYITPVHDHMFEKATGVPHIIKYEQRKSFQQRNCFVQLFPSSGIVLRNNKLLRASQLHLYYSTCFILSTII